MIAHADEQLREQIKRLSQRILRLRSVERDQYYAKLYGIRKKHDPELRQRVKRSEQVLTQVIERFYDEWGQRAPLPTRKEEFVIGGSHRKLDKHRKDLYFAGILYRSLGNREWRVRSQDHRGSGRASCAGNAGARIRKEAG